MNNEIKSGNALSKHRLATIAFLLLTGTLIACVIPLAILLVYKTLEWGAYVSALPALALVLLSLGRGGIRRAGALAGALGIGLVGVFSAGVGEAHRALYNLSNAYVFVADKDQSTGEILRHVQGFALVWRPNSTRVDLVPLSKIDRLTHVIGRSYDAPWFETLPCHALRLLCRTAPPPTP